MHRKLGFMNLQADAGNLAGLGGSLFCKKKKEVEKQKLLILIVRNAKLVYSIQRHK